MTGERFKREKVPLWKKVEGMKTALDVSTKEARRVPELEAAHKELEEHATTDSLTELLNRRGLFTYSEAAINRADHTGNPLAVLYMDLDGFKRINDTYGHSNGDLALKETARIIKQHIRLGDIASRLGGDEFVILLENTTESGAADRAENIRNSLMARSVKTKKGVFQLKPSIGIAIRDDHQTMDELMSEADAAMYSEKKKNKAPIRKRKRTDELTRDLFDNER